MHIGDEYSEGRYRIIHKLGSGSYSTIWLAKDQHRDCYVAMKIIIAAASETSSENKIMECLNSPRSNSTKAKYVTPMFDDFYINGPNGRHLCLVSEPASCNLANSKEASAPYRMFPMDVARAIAAQAILGLRDIHSHGIVHGGK